MDQTKIISAKTTPTRYVYALRLQRYKFYVGATGNLPKRLSAHFRGKGAAKATQEISPIAVETVYQVDFFQIAGTPGWKIIEALLAAEIARKLGAGRVRGALHGEGWSDTPSENQVKVVRRYRNYLEKGRLCGFFAKIRKLEFFEINFSIETKEPLDEHLYDREGFSIHVA